MVTENNAHFDSLFLHYSVKLQWKNSENNFFSFWKNLVTLLLK